MMPPGTGRTRTDQRVARGAQLPSLPDDDLKAWLDHVIVPALVREYVSVLALRRDSSHTLVDQTTTEEEKQ